MRRTSSPHDIPHTWRTDYAHAMPPVIAPPICAVMQRTSSTAPTRTHTAVPGTQHHMSLIDDSRHRMSSNTSGGRGLATDAGHEEGCNHEIIHAKCHPADAHLPFRNRSRYILVQSLHRIFIQMVQCVGAEKTQTQHRWCRTALPLAHHNEK